ncbi:hypothetical protein M1N79_04815 [Dehalococcoidia bacterium]|nr:hypothetical protein [Dehalococcoidia bacterium]
MFLIESSVIGLVGGIIGVVFGLVLSTGTSLVLCHFVDLELLVVISAPLILGTLLFSLLAGAIAGMFADMASKQAAPRRGFSLRIAAFATGGE